MRYEGLSNYHEGMCRYHEDMTKRYKQMLREFDADGDRSFLQPEGKHGDSTNTTVMLKNVPKTFSLDKLLRLLDRNGFNAKYDFVYLPVNFKTTTKLGYAFVNFIDHACAQEFKQQFRGFGDWGQEEEQEAETCWGQLHCKQKHIQRYRNSPLMHHSVPHDWKPVLFDCNGRAETFPAPTKRLQPPRAIKAFAGTIDSDRLVSGRAMHSRSDCSSISGVAAASQMSCVSGYEQKTEH